MAFLQYPSRRPRRELFWESHCLQSHGNLQLACLLHLNSIYSVSSTFTHLDTLALGSSRLRINDASGVQDHDIEETSRAKTKACLNQTTTCMTIYLVDESDYVSFFDCQFIIVLCLIWKYYFAVVLSCKKRRKHRFQLYSPMSWPRRGWYFALILRKAHLTVD